MHSRKLLLLFLLIGLPTVIIVFIPDLVSEDFRSWCLHHLGPSYPWYMSILFLVGCFILLSSKEVKDLLGLNVHSKGQAQIELSWLQAAKQHLKTARDTIKEAQPEETIKVLSNLKNAVVGEQLSMLSLRLAQYRQDSRLGILNSEQKEITLNRINKDLLDLIKALENQLSEGEKENQQLRAVLRQRYQNRLSQKLASRQPVNLRLFTTKEGTSETVAATYVPYGNAEIGDEISKIFQDAFGRLLIVGQPGSGKTTLLLQLADRLFDLEEDSIPVVLNLVTWQTSYGNLETWLEAVLSTEISTNKAGEKAVLRQSNLILLLDGLDELKADEAINSCLTAISDYGSVPGRRFIITCRIEEYKRVAEDARVNLQIEVGPLRGDQLEAELIRMDHEQPEARPMLNAIKKDPLLRKIVEIPFFFNTLQLLFAGRLPVFAADDLEGRKTEIKQKFVEVSLKLPQNSQYPSSQAKLWLSFIASRMNYRNKVVFELRDLQYDWWQGWSRWNIVANNIYVGLFGGGCIGLVLFALTGEMLLGLVLGPLLGLALGLLGTADLPIITTRDFVRWSIKVYSKYVKKHSLKGLMQGLMLSLILRPNEGVLSGVLPGLLLGLILVLILALVDMIKNESSDIIQIKSPYQRFYASIKVLHFSIIQHGLLRRMLYKKGVLPLNLVDFLNEMSARNLLETDGATWRFRHRIIQDYFAEQWEEHEQEK